MKTVTVQIGNSDDKLTQKEWHHFVESVDNVVRTYAKQVHFCGCSDSSAPWQNTAWVFEIDVVDRDCDCLLKRLAEIRKAYNQESVAWTEGDTAFI